MIWIKFNDSNEMLSVEGSRTSDNIVTLIGSDIPQNESGFQSYSHKTKKHLGDFSDFVTIYRVLDNGIQFSNDGSVWVEPEPQPEPPIPPEPIDPQPSWNDMIEAQVLYTAMMTDTLIEE